MFLRQHVFWHAQWDHNRLIRSQRPMLAFIRPSSRRCELIHHRKINKGHARRVTHTMDYLTGLITEVQRLRRRRSCLKGSIYMSTANRLKKADVERLRKVRVKICMALKCIWMKSCCTRLPSLASQLISMREIQFLSHTCQQVLMMHQKLTHCQHMVVYVVQLLPQHHQGHRQIKW